MVKRNHEVPTLVLVTHPEYANADTLRSIATRTAVAWHIFLGQNNHDQVTIEKPYASTLSTLTNSQQSPC